MMIQIIKDSNLQDSPHKCRIPSRAMKSGRFHKAIKFIARQIVNITIVIPLGHHIMLSNYDWFALQINLSSLWNRPQVGLPSKEKRHSWEAGYLVLLKALNMIGGCQRPVFSLGVSQHMHKITNLWKFELNWSSKLQENNEEKTPLLHKFVCFQMPNQTSGLKSIIIWVRNYLFLKNYVTSEGAVSHNVLYYQQLSIARYQVSFYANNYFE